MSARDEAVEAAAKAIHEAGDWDEPWTGADWRADCARNEARAALEAAAPHMLPRTIATVEELDALPFESVIRDGDECVLELWGDLEESGWVTVMVTSFVPRDQITLPATVLYEPGAK